MKCPKCDVTLRMSERQGIEIDYCPDCRGVWLDRGELDKIIERSESWGGGDRSEDAERAARVEDRHEVPSYARTKKKGGGSFIGDLFETLGG
jgi:uncharacterized protein